jgi:hypothetical protein
MRDMVVSLHAAFSYFQDVISSHTKSDQSHLPRHEQY